MEPSFVQTLNFWARDASNESAALRCAFQIGLLEALPPEGQGGGASAAELAGRLGCVERGVRSLLEVHAGLGIARVERGRYWLSADHAPLAQDEALRARLAEAARAWPATHGLTRAIREDAPVDVGGRPFDLLGWYQRCFQAPPGSGPVEAYVDRFQNNFLRTRALIAAGELALLEQIASGPKAADALAEAVGASERGLAVLVRCLTSMGVLAQSDGKIAYTPAAGKALEGSSLAYFMRALPATDVYWEGLGDLESAVRHARFVLDLRDPAIAARVYSENASRITGIFEAHLRLARGGAKIVRHLRPLANAQVLDVGTGSGVWGAAFAEAEPTATVTYVDLPHVLEGVRRNLEEKKLAGQARFWATDCIRTDFGEARYDVILLPQIIPVVPHEELPAFLGRVARALRPDGVLGISGYVLDDRRSGPMDALYFSLRRYLTNEGDVFSLPDFTRMLTELGLPRVRLFELPIQQFVTATRAELAVPPALEKVARRAAEAKV